MLDEERVGLLGLNDEPQPYVVPTDFAFEDGAIYIHTPDRGLKARLARANPNVCFEVDRYNETVTDFRSVIIRGRMTEVSDPAERAGGHAVAGPQGLPASTMPPPTGTEESIPARRPSPFSRSRYAT